MADDTPRYGSRKDPPAPRRPEDRGVPEERPARPSYPEPPYPQSEHDTAPARTPGGPFLRSSQDDGYGDNEGVRRSRYDLDEPAPPARDVPPARDAFSSSLSRENGNYRPGAGSETDKYRTDPAAPSYGDTDNKPAGSNPLLRSETPLRRFSWEDPAPEPAPPPKRTARAAPDYEPPRYKPRKPRSEDVAAERSQPRPYSDFGSEREDDYRYRSPAPGYGARPDPAPAPRETRRGYADEPALRAERYYDTDQRSGYQQYDERAYLGAHTRELADVDQGYGREYPYTADGADPRRDYVDYGSEFQAYDNEYGDYPPPKRRRGPFLLIGSLVAVVVIAGGVVFAWQALKPGDQKQIPVVTVDEEPVKVEPQSQPAAPEPPQKTKLIYDRIRAEDTEQESNLVPREEEPNLPPPQEQSNNDAASDEPELTIDPTSETTETETEVASTDPLPLPLPPPPVDSSEDTSTDQPTFNTTTQNLNTGGEVIVPVDDSEPPAPASQENTASVTPDPKPDISDAASNDTDPATTDTPTDYPKSVAKLIESPPLPREKPTPPSRQAEDGVAVPTGPIKIAPLPGSVDREAPTPDQVSNDQTQPLQLQTSPQNSPSVTPQQTPTRIRTGRFSDQEPGGDTNSSTQLALAPTPQQQPPQQPPPQQEEQPLTGGRYLIQVNSFRSESEAQEEFKKMQSRHPSLLGSYSSLIQRADLGATGTYYRLRIGPIDTRSRASKLCVSLIAAGERDCVVRDR